LWAGIQIRVETVKSARQPGGPSPFTDDELGRIPRFGLGGATAQISEGPGAPTPEPSGSPMPSEDYSFSTA